MQQQKAASHFFETKPKQNFTQPTNIIEFLIKVRLAKEVGFY